MLRSEYERTSVKVHISPAVSVLDHVFSILFGDLGDHPKLRRDQVVLELTLRHALNLGFYRKIRSVRRSQRLNNNLTYFLH